MRCFLLLLILLALPASACLNEYETPEPKPDFYVTQLREILARGNTGWPERAKELARRVRADSANYKLRNDWAVALLHTGEVGQALQLLRGIEEQIPGQYQTAANLGTALELSGNNSDALRWIKEGIRRNPKDHQGTEWVHVAILEAKLALAKDPTWLKTHTVLGYDFGSDDVPRMPAQLASPAEQQRVASAIDYQLRERLQFVKPPDPTVADLLETMALLKGPQTESGLGLLELAQEFGPSHPEQVRARLNLASTGGWPWKPLLATVALVVGLTVLIRRPRRVNID